MSSSPGFLETGSMFLSLMLIQVLLVIEPLGAAWDITGVGLVTHIGSPLPPGQHVGKVSLHGGVHLSSHWLCRERTENPVTKSTANVGAPKWYDIKGTI